MTRSKRPSQGRKNTERKGPARSNKGGGIARPARSNKGGGIARPSRSSESSERERASDSDGSSRRHSQRRSGSRNSPNASTQEPLSSDWAYGLHTLEEMMRAQSESIDEIIVAEGAQGKLARLAEEAQEKGLRVKFRPRTFLQRLLGDVNYQGVAIKVRDFPYQELDTLIKDPGQRALLFPVGVQDPGNLGALLRSSKAFGVSGVVIPERDGCGVNATVRKVSAGAASSMPVARVRNVTQAIKQMKEAGWWLIGLAGEGSSEIDTFDLAMPVVFLLGAEGKGLPPTVVKQCDALLRIPMTPNWDSLNVAASGAIALYEWHRQTRGNQESEVPTPDLET